MKPEKSRAAADTALAASACPCGSGQPYATCCGEWHRVFAESGALTAPDAQALMRSRYTGFVLNLIDYLLATWHPSTRPAGLEPNDPGLQWLGLTIKRHECQDEAHATVEFVARSKQAGRAHRMHETSRFVRENGAWRYLDGDLH